MLRRHRDRALELTENGKVGEECSDPQILQYLHKSLHYDLKLFTSQVLSQYSCTVFLLLSFSLQSIVLKSTV